MDGAGSESTVRSTVGGSGMFKTAKITSSLDSDWEYTVTNEDVGHLKFLLQVHQKIGKLPPMAAAGLFLCHRMKRDYEFTSFYFPDVLIKILNLPLQFPDKLNARDAETLRLSATAALIHHQHPYLETFADYLQQPAA